MTPVPPAAVFQPTLPLMAISWPPIAPSYHGRPVNGLEFNGLLALIEQVQAAHRLLFAAALQLLNSLT